MLIQTTAPIRDYDGTPCHMRTRPDGQADTTSPVVTLREVVYRALNDPRQEPNGEDSARRFRLSVAFFANATIDDLSIEDVAFIKECAGKALAPLPYGRLCELFDRAAQVTPAPSSNGVASDALATT